MSPEIPDATRCTCSTSGNVPFLLTLKEYQKDKAWGAEYIISSQPHACKIMKVLPGGECSLHWHAIKSETFMLIEGVLEVTVVDPSTGVEYVLILDKIYDSITIPPNVPHTFRVGNNSQEPAIFIEASTEDHPDDSYRIYPSRGPAGQDTDNR
jgi:mannose-6-phosphate isomerase-like protein (cupin superfamily)